MDFFFFFWGIFWFDLSFRCYGFIGCLEMDEGICFCWIWFLTEASMVVVMFDHNFYKTLTFLSCFLLFFYVFFFFNFFILYIYIYIYLYLFMFWEERHKREQKYLFSPIFNRGGYRNSNWANLKWVKCQLSNYG